MFGLGEILIDGEDRFSTVIREKVVAKVGWKDIRQGWTEIWKFFPQTVLASSYNFV